MAAVFDIPTDASATTYPYIIQQYQQPFHADDLHVHSTCSFELLDQEMINPVPLQVSDHDQVFFSEPCCPPVAISVEKTSVLPT